MTVWPSLCPDGLITTCGFQDASIIPTGDNNDQISLVSFADGASCPLPSSPNQIDNRTVVDDSILFFHFHFRYDDYNYPKI